MKKSIKFAMAAFIAVLSVIVSVSCKKESNASIIFKSYNITFTDTTTLGINQFAGIDIDGDAINDFILYGSTFSPDDNDTIVNQIGLAKQDGTDNGLVDTVITPNPSDPDISFGILKFLNSGDKIGSSSTFNSDEPAVILRAFKNSTLLASFGVTDNADKFIGFKFKIGSVLHYGWLKINLSADKKTLTIKEGAYNTDADEEINAGEK